MRQPLDCLAGGVRNRLMKVIFLLCAIYICAVIFRQQGFSYKSYYTYLMSGLPGGLPVTAVSSTHDTAKSILNTSATSVIKPPITTETQTTNAQTTSTINIQPTWQPSTIGTHRRMEYSTQTRMLASTTELLTTSPPSTINKNGTNVFNGMTNQTTPAGVPMLLHFIYKDTNMLQAYRANIESCIKFNTNWTVVLWTDDTMESFISREFPHYKTVFYRFPHKIQRADAIRYLILYRFGGVYMDLDMRCRQPLLASLSDIPCFLDREREHQTQVLHGRQFFAMNSAMGCIPAHPFFKKVAEFVLHPDRLKGAFHFPYTIFLTTGPHALTELYNEWLKSKSQPSVTLLSESYFSPMVNPRSGVYGTCRNVLAGMRRNKSKFSIGEKACLDVERLGFEKSDEAFTTNVTVAIHEFTHLGYYDQKTPRFDILKVFPSVKLYDSH